MSWYIIVFVAFEIDEYKRLQHLLEHKTLFYASINEQKTARHCPRDYSKYDGLIEKDILKVESSAFKMLKDGGQLL